MDERTTDDDATPGPKKGSISDRVNAAKAKERTPAGGGAVPKTKEEEKPATEEREGGNEPQPEGVVLADQLASKTRVESASQSASNVSTSLSVLGGGDSISLADLIGGGVDPERDLVQLNGRVPRYVKAALTSTVGLTRNSPTPLTEQNILTEALKRILPARVLDQARQNARTNRGFDQ